MSNEIEITNFGSEAIWTMEEPKECRWLARYWGEPHVLQQRWVSKNLVTGDTYEEWRDVSVAQP